MFFNHVLASALNALKVPLVILSQQRECLFATDSFCAFLGFDGAPSGVLKTLRFWPAIDQVRLDDANLNCEFIACDGKTIPVSIVTLPLPDDNILIRIVSGDTTTNAPESFHAQRLSMLGMLAGGVAHDFNNILAGILGHITYLTTILPARGEHTESLSAIEEGARKASSMTQQILNFSKVDSAEGAVRIDVAALILRTCSLLRGALSPDYKLDCLVSEDKLWALAGEGKLSQVIANLVINARDASTPGSAIRVELSVENEQEDVFAAFGTREVSSAKYLKIEVADAGHGIPPQVLARVFEPYFSTKNDKGTGLGLATVSSIVRLFGGAIRISSQVDLGTSVSVYLPMIAGPNDPVREQGNKSVRLQGGDERIIVIDDEGPVRNVLSLSLQHLGYAVETASSGKEGVAKYLEAEVGFDLVILDMLMPALSGRDVFFKLLAADPKVRVLLISGYSSEEAVQAVLSHGGLGFLQKPFTIEELAKKVRYCLDLGLELGADSADAPKSR